MTILLRTGAFASTAQGQQSSLAAASSAFEHIRKLAKAGNADAQYELGRMYLRASNDFSAAAKWLEKAAQQGHADAQFRLGVMYKDGTGVFRNSAEGARLMEMAAGQYRTAAEQGDARAMYQLGRMADANWQGHVAAEWYKWAAEQYRKAAEQGNAEAQYQLGYMYSRGEGVGRDEVEAFSWYKMAAANGHMEAQYILGDEGARHGVIKDKTERLKWFKLAAEQGHSQAQWRLGLCYHVGDCPRDKTEAAGWYRVAADQGDTAAQIHYWELTAGKLTDREETRVRALYHLVTTLDSPSARPFWLLFGILLLALPVAWRIGWLLAVSPFPEGDGGARTIVRMLLYLPLFMVCCDILFALFQKLSVSDELWDGFFSLRHHHRVGGGVSIVCGYAGSIAGEMALAQPSFQVLHEVKRWSFPVLFPIVLCLFVICLIIFLQDASFF
jgi:TPR repeat protein